MSEAQAKRIAELEFNLKVLVAGSGLHSDRIAKLEAALAAARDEIAKWTKAVSDVQYEAVRLSKANAKLEAALAAFHYYVCASDREMAEAGITREDALVRAYKLHDEIFGQATS